MTSAKRIFKMLSEFRKLINEPGRPEAGIGGYRVSKQALAAQALTIFGFWALTLFTVWITGDHEAFWLMLTFLISSTLTLLPGSVIGWRFDNQSQETPILGKYVALCSGSVILGIPLGHLGLWAMNKIHLLETDLFSLTFAPEAVMAVGILAGYWRLVYVRQWEFKVNTEKLKREAAEHGHSLAQAQLKMLQAQIEPHFLFNTLASVQHLVRKDPQLADFLLTELIRYLRQAMPDFRGMGSTLGREFGLNEAYLNIAKIRMGERLTVNVSIPESLVEISFPPLVIQTLVENAIKHGIEPKTGPVSVSIFAREVFEGGSRFIEIGVVDDGVGFGNSSTSGTSVGLRNIQERLKGLYGDSAVLEISNAAPTGVCAIVRIPAPDKGSSNGMHVQPKVST